MKELITILILCLVSIGAAIAQDNIVAMEYYIDEDPGLGLGTPISVSTGPSIDINITIPVSGMGLSIGPHLLVIRSQNLSGEWSMYEVRKFLIAEIQDTSPPPLLNITEIEYLIDSDPGVGTATSTSISASTMIDINNVLDVTALSSGFHSISYRAKDESNQWGFYETRIFYIQNAVNPNPTPENIISLEYYFDDDPGQGNATSISVSPGQIIDIQEIIPNSLSEGFHVIGIRAQDALGNWGFAETRVVYVNPGGAINNAPLKITDLEYFYGEEDPGYGNGTLVDIDPDTEDVDIASLLITSALDIPVGTNKISFRARNENGLWGFKETREFEVIDDCTQPVAAFEVSLACAGEQVSFTDLSTDIQGDAEYRWYFNGDQIVDSNIIGNTNYTFTNPGTYDVSLAISQGQICYDSVGTTITIKPKPIVVFNADRVEVGSATSYTVDQFNVDPASIWSWDFESDAIIDDNTIGNTTNIFPSASSYLTTLEVTDGLGCSTTYSKAVTVDPVSSGGGPTANFDVQAECAGRSTLFIDNSSDLPLGTTYSWDFDGDGLEDSNAVGNASFIYSNEGIYTAILTLNTGSETLIYNEIININDIPNAEFTHVGSCDNAVVSFTDISTNVAAGASYSWDFNNDGVEDDNTVGNVSHDYSIAGNYIAILTITNGECTDAYIANVSIPAPIIPSFISNIACVGSSSTFNNNSTNTSASTTYSWDFDGDGIEDSKLLNGDYIYGAAGSYDVSLNATSDNGCSYTISQTIEVKEAPVLAFDISPGCPGDPVSFTNNSTNLSADAAVSWDFNNDGIVDSNASDDSFTFTGTGPFFTSLSIDNGAGCITELIQEVEFNNSPVPDFNVSNNCLGEATIFTDLTTGTGSNTTYAWDFNNDGIIDSAVPGSVSFQYNQPGTYSINLAISANGCLAEVVKVIEVYPIPEISLPNQFELCEDETLVIDAGPGFTSYLWNDGTNNQTLEVSEAGIYSVEVTDNNGCTNSASTEVLVRPLPIAEYNVMYEVAEQSVTIYLENLSQNANSYLWDFGDGQSSNESNPIHTYSDINILFGAVYELCLTSSNDCNESTLCQFINLTVTNTDSFLSNEIKVYPNPVNGILNVQMPQDHEYNVEVYSKTGKLALSGVLRQNQINMSSLESGQYYIKLSSGNENYIQKIIVK